MLNDGGDLGAPLINTNRPNTSDPIVDNQNFFPTEAFEFDNPNDLKGGTDKVELKMKDGWKFYVEGIQLDQLDVHDRIQLEDAIIRSKDNELHIINNAGSINLNAEEIELRVKGVSQDGLKVRDALINMQVKSDGSLIQIDANSIIIGDIDGDSETLDGVISVVGPDLIIGDYAGGSGIKWTQGTGVFDIKGSLNAATGSFVFGIIENATITDGTFSGQFSTSVLVTESEPGGVDVENFTNVTSEAKNIYDWGLPLGATAQTAGTGTFEGTDFYSFKVEFKDNVTVAPGNPTLYDIWNVYFYDISGTLITSVSSPQAFVAPPSMWYRTLATGGSPSSAGTQALSITRAIGGDILLMIGLPTSASGLETNQVWRDTSGYLRIV